MRASLRCGPILNDLKNIFPNVPWSNPSNFSVKVVGPPGQQVQIITLLTAGDHTTDIYSPVQSTNDEAGLVTNSILFCLLPRIGVKSGTFQTLKHGLRQLCSKCPGTSAPSTAHLIVSLLLCCSGSNARGKSRAHQGCRRVLCLLKKGLQGSKTETRELLGGIEENSVHQRGVIDFQQDFFYNKETEMKNELAARPVVKNTAWRHLRQFPSLRSTMCFKTRLGIVTSFQSPFQMGKRS